MAPNARSIAVLAALAAVGGTRPADGRPRGALGFDLMAMGLQGGLLDQRGTLSDPSNPAMPGPAFDGRGAAGLFRIRFAGLTERAHTRFGSLAGIEAALGAGWLSRNAIAHDQGTEGIRLRQVFLDLDAALIVAPLHRDHWRLLVAGGIALSTERAAWIVGPRFHYRFRRNHIAVRADYRPGRAWKGYDSREARLGFDLGVGGRRTDEGFGFGIEVWLGRTTAADELAPRDRALRGDYLAVLASIERRW